MFPCIVQCARSIPMSLYHFFIWENINKWRQNKTFASPRKHLYFPKHLYFSFSCIHSKTAILLLLPLHDYTRSFLHHSSLPHRESPKMRAPSNCDPPSSSSQVILTVVSPASLLPSLILHHCHLLLRCLLEGKNQSFCHWRAILEDNSSFSSSSVFFFLHWTRCNPPVLPVNRSTRNPTYPDA